MDREFGLKIDFLNNHFLVVQNLYTLKKKKKTDKYESRVKVSEVTFETKEGKIYATVHLVKR